MPNPVPQDIAVGEFRDLFLRQLDAFIDACRDKSAGELYDPARGKIRAKCISFESVLDAQNRGGETVHVDFVDAPELGKVVERVSPLAALAGAQYQASRLDGKIEKAKPVPNEDPPAPFINPLRQINGLARQGLAFQGRLAARIDDVSASLEELEDTRKKASDPEQIEINRASRNLRATLQRSKIIQDPARVLIDLHVSGSKTLVTVASQAGLSVAELLQLNPTLNLRSLTVPSGTRLKAYKRVG
jgi:hypothetical protein